MSPVRHAQQGCRRAARSRPRRASRPASGQRPSTSRACSLDPLERRERRQVRRPWPGRRRRRRRRRLEDAGDARHRSAASTSGAPGTTAASASREPVGRICVRTTTARSAAGADSRARGEARRASPRRCRACPPRAATGRSSGGPTRRARPASPRGCDGARPGPEAERRGQARPPGRGRPLARDAGLLRRRHPTITRLARKGSACPSVHCPSRPIRRSPS